LKIIHTADSHLGLNVSKTRPSDVEGRERRAQGIWENFLRVVHYALDVEADLFIHSGDLFDKAYIPEGLLHHWVTPLIELSKAGITVLVIPGNHERSQFPFDLFHGTKNIYVFDSPKSVSVRLSAYTVAAAGFPFIRDNSRQTFGKALEETEYQCLKADINILVTHQAFDSAVVGPNGFIFTTRRSDTVGRECVPTHFHYIAAGHIHRYQVLSHPLETSIPFAYPGSIQRMSFAEMEEGKGFIHVEVAEGKFHIQFRHLPAHDMEVVEIDAGGMTSSQLKEAILAHSWRCHPQLVIKFLITGGSKPSDYPSVELDDVRRSLPAVLECQFAFRIRNRWVIA
jgi:exonuclease SbcD